MLFELLINRSENIFPVNMKILYNEKFDECEIKVSYGGEKYNPLEDFDDLSVTILKGIIQNVDYNFEDKNILNMKCK